MYSVIIVSLNHTKFPTYLDLYFFFSKMEYIYFIQYGGSKNADGFNSFLNNKWRHHDINSIVKVYLRVSQLLESKGIKIYG